MTSSEILIIYVILHKQYTHPTTAQEARVCAVRKTTTRETLSPVLTHPPIYPSARARAQDRLFSLILLECE